MTKDTNLSSKELNDFEFSDFEVCDHALKMCLKITSKKWKLQLCV